MYSDAAKIVKGSDSSKYHELVQQAIVMYGMCGKTSNAATMSRDAAEKAEEDYDYTFAIQMYE